MSQIKLRRATPDDMRSLFEWRNAPETRHYAFDPKPIAWEDHQRWFRASLGRDDRHLLIGEMDGEAVGVLRYDVEEKWAEISIYLVPGKSGRGLGTALLCAGNAWLALNLPAITSIRAKILPENIPSRKAFLKAGYVESGGNFEYHVVPDGNIDNNRVEK
jgi:UDP-2,4-diacetamido-2,4,6-trideoxy-beta-L-altropyranose hydrolase